MKDRILSCAVEVFFLQDNYFVKIGHEQWCQIKYNFNSLE